MKTKLYILLVVFIIALSAKGYRVDAEGYDVSGCETESLVKDFDYLSVVAQINSDSILSSLFFQRNKTVEQNAPVYRWVPGCFKGSSGILYSKLFNRHTSGTEVTAELFSSEGCFYTFHNIRI